MKSFGWKMMKRNLKTGCLKMKPTKKKQMNCFGKKNWKLTRMIGTN
jgi:hypothetical protein